MLDGNKNHGLVEEMDVSFQNWNLDPPIDNKTFTLSFPKGTLVQDKGNHTTYHAKEIDDELIAKQVDDAKRLKSLYESLPPPAPQSSVLGHWLIGSFVFAAVVGGAVTILILRSRRSVRGAA